MVNLRACPTPQNPEGFQNSRPKTQSPGEIYLSEEEFNQLIRIPVACCTRFLCLGLGS